MAEWVGLEDEGEGRGRGLALDPGEDPLGGAEVDGADLLGDPVHAAALDEVVVGSVADLLGFEVGHGALRAHDYIASSLCLLRGEETVPATSFRVHASFGVKSAYRQNSGRSSAEAAGRPCSVTAGSSSTAPSLFLTGEVEDSGNHENLDRW